MNKTGPSRTSTNNSIYILHQVITYNPTLTIIEMMNLKYVAAIFNHTYK